MKEPAMGIAELKGPAIDLFAALLDDNHADPASEERALENFDSFGESFFAKQREFINEAESRKSS